MARKTQLAPGEFYHIYNRGTDKRKIFTSAGDYQRFLALLYLCNSSTPVRIENISRDASEQGLTLLKAATAANRGETIVDLAAYCLMPNHFHLIVREKAEGGISRFMQKLVTGYSMYFNKRYERAGALFQGTFKATAASNDLYLKYLVSYVHLNPVKLIDPMWKETGIKNKSRAKEYLEKYRYSSYLDYLEQDRLEKVLIDKNVLPKYFETPKSFKENMSDWMNYKNTEVGVVEQG